MDDATQKIIDGLRHDADNYGRKMRGEIEPGETFSWDQSHVRAWEAADALEATQRPPVSPEQREALVGAGIRALVESPEVPTGVHALLTGEVLTILEAVDAESVVRVVLDAILAHLALPVLDVEKAARVIQIAANRSEDRSPGQTRAEWYAAALAAAIENGELT